MKIKDNIEIINRFRIRESENQLEFTLLKHTKSLEEHDHGISEILSVFYDSKSKFTRMMGTLLNASYSQQRLYFMCGVEAFSNLLRTDQMIKRETINGTEYKQLITHLKLNSYVKVFRKAPGSGIYMSTIYKWHDREIKKLIKSTNTKYYFDKQRANTAAFFDEKLKTYVKKEIKKNTTNNSAQNSTDSVNVNGIVPDSVSGLVENEIYKKDFFIKSIADITYDPEVESVNDLLNSFFSLLDEDSDKLADNAIRDVVYILAVWLTIRGEDRDVVEQLDLIISGISSKFNGIISIEMLHEILQTSLRRTPYILKSTESIEYLSEERKAKYSKGGT